MKKLTLLTAASLLALALPLSGCKDKDAAAPAPSAPSAEEIAKTVTETETEMAMPDTGEMPVMTAQEAADYLAANAKRDAVITTDTGLQYTINRSGDASGVSPTAGQRVKVHYEGKFTNGTMFDSSYERGQPAIFPSDQLIPGWVEALSLMKPGDEWTLFISPDLGYGPGGLKDPRDGTVVIPENAVLIFRMELLENM